MGEFAIYGESRVMKSSIRVLKQQVLDIFARRRKMNEKWDLMFAKINMQGRELEDARTTRKGRVNEWESVRSIRNGCGKLSARI